MADSAEEPLMRPSIEDEPVHDVDLSDVSLLLEKNLRHPGIYVWLLTFSAGISGLLFGYDTGVISATLVSIDSSLGHPLTTLDKSLITSCTSLFALLLLPTSSILADTLGRKSVVLLADFAFILGAVVQATANTVWGMIAGRSIVGLAVGAGSFVTPLYISELAPAPFRGRLVTLNVLFITLGQVVAYIVGWAFVEWGNELTGWRWIVGLGAVPAAIQGIVILAMPESPRWLVQNSRNEEARSVLNKVFGKGTDVQKMVDGVLRGIEIEVREEDEAKRGRMRGVPTKKGGSSWLAIAKDNWSELFRNGGNRRALAIACLLQGLQQLCGFNSLMYFSATIFTLLGFTSPTLASLSVALTNFLLTCVALGLIDRVGKRRMLLWSIPVMAVGLLLCSAGFHFITLPADFNSANAPPPSEHESDPLSERTASMLVLASVMVYVGSYALGLGNVPWMQSELFPLNVRSIGSGIATATNWGSNFVIGLTFLPMMEFLTPSWTFVIYAGVCLAGWFAILRIYPETKGMSLEEMGALLANGWGVEESVRRAEQA